MAEARRHILAVYSAVVTAVSLILAIFIGRLMFSYSGDEEGVLPLADEVPAAVVSFFNFFVPTLLVISVLGFSMAPRFGRRSRRFCLASGAILGAVAIVGAVRGYVYFVVSLPEFSLRDEVWWLF